MAQVRKIGISLTPSLAQVVERHRAMLALVFAAQGTLREPTTADAARSLLVAGASARGYDPLSGETLTEAAEPSADRA